MSRRQEDRTFRKASELYARMAYSWEPASWGSTKKSIDHITIPSSLPRVEFDLIENEEKHRTYEHSVKL